MVGACPAPVRDGRHLRVQSSHGFADGGEDRQHGGIGEAAAGGGCQAVRQRLGAQVQQQVCFHLRGTMTLSRSVSARYLRVYF